LIVCLLLYLHRLYAQKAFIYTWLLLLKNIYTGNSV